MDTLEAATRRIEALGFHLKEKGSSETVIEFRKRYTNEGWKSSYGGSYDATTGQYELFLLLSRGSMGDAPYSRSHELCNDFANKVQRSLENAGIGATIEGDPDPVIAEAKREIGIPEEVSVGSVQPRFEFFPQLKVTGPDLDKCHSQLTDAAVKFGYHLYEGGGRGSM
jgi:hypothetical protein